MEALEESGLTIDNAQIKGRVNVNSTFFAHPQYVVHAEIKAINQSRPENLEILGDTHFFTMEELRELNDQGKFDDGLTLSALALCGLSI